MTFNNLDLVEPILDALKDTGYVTPTPIQQEAIPLVLEGADILGCAQTGTGKTAAFSIPIIQNIYNIQYSFRARKEIKALILTPTRELAIQIGECFEQYGKYTEVKHTVIFGGVGQNPQVTALKRGVDVLIATPGRLLDLVGQGYIKLNNLKYFVLDEADHMLDMGFIHDIKRILPLLPKQRQSLFFSATMPPEIEKLAARILSNPKKVEVTPASSTVDKIDQHLYFVEDKADLLIELLQNPEMESVLVFTRTKHGADKVVRILKSAHIQAEAIHGNKSQNARQKALNNFKTGFTRVLIATDIAARGIDVDDLSHVVNYELPNVPETYVHRIGRTGRAGRTGVAYSFCNAEEVPFLRDIEKLIGFKIKISGGTLFNNSEIKSAVEGRKAKVRENMQKRTMFKRGESSRRPEGAGTNRSERSTRSSERPSGRREGGNSRNSERSSYARTERSSNRSGSRPSRGGRRD